MDNKAALDELIETKEFLNKSLEFAKDTRLILHIEALDIAISAIEKQIPKKWGKEGSWMNCPICDHSEDKYEIENHCRFCGQRLKED